MKARVNYVQRAREEIARAWKIYHESQALGRTAARTRRLRSAKWRAGKWLRYAVIAGQISKDEAEQIYASAPKDPIYRAG